MKKFLSLLLALVMTMSLVTISAGATEYKDLTDKDELGPQYQEAVAVLNKIGVITGYDDGSFRPDVELTRGAAAKIIVSMLIGPEAAGNLPNNYAPYPDVPANHTFAGVISYCKTAGIINGYGDGTFKPANDLTGYAFAKMLLSALGYDNTIEKFVDTGWTMNVLNVGQAAGLFDRLDFKGSDAVTRKDAALLALNTLKATVVEYKNGQNITVTGENTNVTVSTDATATYKTSNQEYARNIIRHVGNQVDDDWYTVEFAEEHFIDLRLTADKYAPVDDIYGRPSSEWSYKKLSIGTFPLESDYEYTTQVIHDVDTVTDGAKTRALGLSGFSIEKSNGNVVTDRANLWINGVGPFQFNSNGTSSVRYGKKTVTLDSVASIANFTDNGTLVQVYIDNNGADFITDVVVIRTQLMEVRRIGSDYVSLDVYDDASDANGDVLFGFNYVPVDEKVNNVEEGDDYYSFLSGLKAGDKVAVVPVAVDHVEGSYDVGEAYTPETVTGALTAVETYGDVSKDRNAINLTVGGTKYNIALWNKDMHEIDSDAIKVTRTDVTLTLDKYGNALLASDVGSTSDWMVIGNYRQGIQNGILVTYANGWDIKGNELSLNIGARAGVSTGTNDVWNENALPPVGSLVYYTNDTNSNTGEWELSDLGVFTVSEKAQDGTTDYTILPSSSRLYLKDAPTGYELPFYKNGVPFIYITLDKSGEVDSFEIKKDPQSVSNKEILGDDRFDSRIQQAQAAISVKNGGLSNADNAGVEAVVIKSESSAVSINNLLYITNYHGSATKDANGNMVQGYEVAMLGAGGKLIDTDKVIYSDRTGLSIGTFARYTESTHSEFEDFYTLRTFGTDTFSTAGDSVAVLKANIAKTGASKAFVGANNRMVYLENDYSATTRASGIYNIEKFQEKADTNLVSELYGNNDAVANLVNLRRAEWLDLTSYRQDIESPSELKDAYSDLLTSGHTTADWHRDIVVTLLFNDNPDSDEFRQVYLIVVNSISTNDQPNTTGGASTETPAGNITVVANGGSAEGAAITTNGDGSVNVGTITLTAPDWAYLDTTDLTNSLEDSSIATSGVKWNLVKGDTKWFGADKDTSLDYNKDKTAVVVTLAGDGAALTTSDKTSIAKAVSEGYKFTLSKVDWKLAKVEYTVNGAAGDFSSKDEKISVSAPTSLNFTLATADTTATAKATVSGIDTTVTGLVASDYQDATIANPLNTSKSVGNNHLQGVYGQKVLVAITTSSPVKSQYSVTVDAASAIAIPGENTVTAAVTATPTTIDAGERVTIHAALSAEPQANAVDSYDVIVKLVDAAGNTVDTVTVPKVADTTGVDVTWVATSNVTIKGSDVTFKANASEAYIEKVDEVTTNSITLSYVGDTSTLVATDIQLLKKSDNGAAPKTPTTVDKSVAGKLTLVFTETLENGDVIAIDTSKIAVFALTSSTEVYVYQISVSGSNRSAAPKGKMTYSAAQALVEASPSEKVAAAKEQIQTALNGVTATNAPNESKETTFASVKTAVESAVGALTLPTGVTTSVTVVETEPATDESAKDEGDGVNGVYTITVTISCDSEEDT